MDDKRKKIIIYDTGKLYWCYEDQLYLAPEPEEKPPRENYSAYNEKETE